MHDMSLPNFLRILSEEVAEVWKVVMWTLGCVEVKANPAFSQTTQPRSVSKAVGEPVGPFCRS